MSAINKFVAGVALATMVTGSALVFIAPPAAATTITVEATADIFLAGQTSIPTTFPYNSDVPGYPGSGYGYGAGILPPSIAVTAGEVLNFSATGTVSCCYGGSPTNGPNGGGLGGSADINGYGNVGPFINPVQFPLVGVFNVGSPWSIIVIGSSDTVVVPIGATSLYLGLPDALGFDNPPGYYNDNTGSFTVNVTATPLPPTWTMLIAGFAGLGFFAYRGTKKSSAAFAAA
jgi:hypothetical protein